MKIRILMFLFSVTLFTSCNNDDNSKFESTEISFTEIGKGALFVNRQEGIPQSNIII